MPAQQFCLVGGVRWRWGAQGLLDCSRDLWPAGAGWCRLGLVQAGIGAGVGVPVSLALPAPRACTAMNDLCTHLRRFLQAIDMLFDAGKAEEVVGHVKEKLLEWDSYRWAARAGHVLRRECGMDMRHVKCLRYRSRAALLLGFTTSRFGPIYTAGARPAPTPPPWSTASRA